MKIKILLYGLLFLIGCASGTNYKTKKPDHNQYDKIRSASAKKRPLIKYLYSNFNHVRNSLKLVYADKDLINISKYPSDLIVESQYFDFIRYFNDFSDMKTIQYPQNQLAKKILLYENLQEGFHSNIKSFENGHIVPNLQNLAKNTKRSKKETKKRQNNSSLLAQVDKVLSPMSYLSQTSPSHDLFVAQTASKGIENIFNGYLSSNKTKIDYFQSIIDKSLFGIGKLNLFFKTLHRHLIEQNDTCIVSMSCTLSDEDWETVSGILENRSDSDGHLWFRSLPEYQILPVLKGKSDDFIWLMALDNRPAFYDDSKRRSVLKVLKRNFPNLVFVSTTPFNTEDGTFKITRKNLEEDNIPFFTVLSSDFNLMPQYDLKYKKIKMSAASNNPRRNIEGFPATSYATPVLSVVLYNMWSLYPSLTSGELISALDTTTINQKHPQKIDGSAGRLVQPKNAYKYILGRLMIDAYSYFYGIQGKAPPIFNLIDASWEIDLESNEAIDFIWEKTSFFKNFYQHATIYNSAAKKSLTIVKKANKKIAPYIIKPQQLKVKILDVKYEKTKVEILIEKTFISKKYSDRTTKKILLDYSRPGNGPSIIKEYPHFTERI